MVVCSGVGKFHLCLHSFGDLYRIHILIPVHIPKLIGNRVRKCGAPRKNFALPRAPCCNREISLAGVGAI